MHQFNNNSCQNGNMIDPKPDINRYLLLAEVLFTQLFLCYALPAAGFILGISMTYYLVAAIVAGLILPTLQTRNQSTIWFVTLGSLAIWAVTELAGGVLMDMSFDGNTYHQEIITLICKGWVPGQPWDGLELTTWTPYYAKAFEIAEATVVYSVGHIEAGKCLNYILGLSTALFVYSFLEERFAKIPVKRRILITLVTVGNPVFLTQMFTFYTDFVKYLLTVISIVTIIKIATSKQARVSIALLCMVIALAAGTKFNIFFEQGVVIFAAWIWLLATKRSRKAWQLVFIGVTAALAGTLILGYHPYVTNYLNVGNPLYPLVGEGSIDIMTTNTPPDYLIHNRFTNFFRSLLSVSPITYDQREGGFGPLMLPMLLISLILVWRTRKRVETVIIYISCWVIASCFIFEQSWWARYNSQLWLILPLGLISLSSSQQFNKLNQLLSKALIIFALLTGCVAVAIQGGSTLRHTLYRRAIEKSLSGSTIEANFLNEVFCRHMNEAGIEVVKLSADNSKLPLPYYTYYIDDPDDDHFPKIYLGAEEYAKVKENVESIRIFDYNDFFEQK